MAIVGFNFTKINVEKKTNAKGKINIKNNVAIKNVENASVSLGSSKQDGLKFTFEYTSKYEPNLGGITLLGDVLDLEDEKTVKEVLDEWKKNKKVPQAIMNTVLNTVLSKCNIEALILSRDINLPPPIPMPKVGVKKPE